MNILVGQSKASFFFQEKPLLILYGDKNQDLHASNLPANVRAIHVQSKFPFGKHHTKMMICHYDDDSVRIIVSTANLIGSDWENRTQGLWVSPVCPKLTDNGHGSGESKTGFKASLLRYIKFYQLTPLQPYIDLISKCDFSAINVFFVSSVPNSHKSNDLNLWGHRQVASILRQYVPEAAQNWPLIVQCSSIGSLGPAQTSWLRSDLGASLMATSKSLSSSTTAGDIAVIYPSKEDVFKSYDGVFGGGCLPYSRRTHEKQTWLESLLHRWKADSRQRTKAMPHIKTYARLSKDDDKLAFFILTSANLSKAAWGMSNKAKDSLQIQSYEAGVLFLPHFVVGEDYFQAGINFPLPYDLPLIKYDSSQSCWFMDYLQETLQY